MITSPYSGQFVCYDKPPLCKQHKKFEVQVFKGNYQSIYSCLSRIPWQDLLSGNNPEENWSLNSLCQYLLVSVIKTVPITLGDLY